MTDPSPHPTGRRRVRWWHVALACFLLLLGAWGGWRVNLRREINAELARIRAEGYPVTPAELEAWYPYPKGENAADVYLRAFAAMVEPTEEEKEILPIVGKAKLPPPGEPIPAEMLAAMEAHLEKNSEALRLLHEAGKVEGCRWPGEGSFPNNQVHRRTPPGVYDAMRLLHLAASRTTLLGDQHASIRSIENAVKLLRSLENEPFISRYAARSTGAAVLAEMIHELIDHSPADEPSLNKLISGLRDRRGETELTRVAVGDRCTTLALLNMFRTAVRTRGRSSWEIAVGDGLVLLSGVVEVYERAYLRHARRIYDFASHPTFEFAQRVDGERDDIPRYAELALHLSPFCVHLLRFKCRLEVALDLTLTALAAERYRLAHGDWPAALEELVPDYLDEVPADPYNHGKPLSVKRHGDRLVIYSFGQDQDDDGGTLGGDEGFGFPVGDGDVIFTLHRQ